MSHAALLTLALLLDAGLGEPDWLWRRLPHPAVLMGRVIDAADRRFNNGAARRLRGAAVVAVLCVAGWLAGALVAALPLGGLLELLAAAVLLAQRSLVEHVSAVADGLRLSRDAGRQAVALIVSRDTRSMDEAAIARSAIESAAENLSDGVIAPAFWFLLFGLPGLLVYKLVNTADSMIGYRTSRHRDFGWAAARLDDLLNWVPARLTALLIVLAHLRFDIWPQVRRDAALHKSPNAGWPEAALAPVLGVALAGPRSYDGALRAYPFVNPAGRHRLEAADIEAAIGALWRVWALALGLTLALAVA